MSATISPEFANLNARGFLKPSKHSSDEAFERDTFIRTSQGPYVLLIHDVVLFMTHKRVISVYPLVEGLQVAGCGSWETIHRIELDHEVVGLVSAGYCGIEVSLAYHIDRSSYRVL